MNRSVLCSVLAIFSVVAWMGFGQEPATSVSTRPAATQAAAIEALIPKLDDDSWDVRQAAQDKLISYGEEAVGVLQAALRTSRVEEIRTRCEAALRQIEQDRITGPSRITIHLKDAHPREVYAELARQARTEFRPYPAQLWQQGRDWPKVTLDVDREPFWSVLPKIVEATGICPQPGYGSSSDRRLALVQGGGAQWLGYPSVAHGPFLVQVQSIQRSASVNLLQPQAIQRDFNLQMCVYAEPKLRILQYSGQPQLDEVVDNKGNSLIGQGNGGGMSSGANFSYSMYVRLSYPEKPGDRIAKLKGTAQFEIQTGSETVEIADILNASEVNKTAGNRRFVVRNLKKENGNQYQLTIAFFRDGIPPQEWNNFHQVLHSQMHGGGMQLLDARGQRYSGYGLSSTSGDGQKYECVFRFGDSGQGDDGAPLGPPAKLVMEITTQSKSIAVPFEFADLPMP